MIRAVLKPEPLVTRAVLFDWDGTLLDSFDSDRRAYQAVFRGFGVRWQARKFLQNYSPNGFRIYRAFRIRRERWEEGDLLWRRAYEKEKPRLLPGARRALRSLHGSFVLGLVTAGDRSRVLKQLRAFGLAHIFSVCICAENTQQRKPHPAPLRLALHRLRVPAKACVYVGDTPEDVEMARRAGVRIIGVRGPFPTAERIRAAHPDRMLDSIRELPRHLRAIRNPNGS